MQASDLIEKDCLQRQQALNPYESFIVQAPAGSGKTELLIQRFLTLLTQVKAPEEILAITFTKKAANEMRLRLLKALKHALTEPKPTSAHAQQTWELATAVLSRDKQFNWNLLTNPNQLRIQTIDSLCTYLTKQLPLLSHFGSQPDISENPTALYREATQEVLLHVEEKYEWSQAISKLLLHLDNDLNKLHDLFVNLLAKRDQWLPYIHLEQHADDIKKQLEYQLGCIISETLQNLTQLIPPHLRAELCVIAQFSQNNIALKSQTATNEAVIFPGQAPNDLFTWLKLSQLLLTKTGSWRKQVNDEIGFPPLASLKNPQEKALHVDYRQRLTALIQQLSENETLRIALSELAYLPKPHYHAEQWEILQSLLLVLKILAAQLRVTFQQHGQIDFIENAQAALLALGSHEHPTDLALALDYQIKHILVDEFQDTSYTQYQLLEKLTLGWEQQDRRTLFVVGDPMQSIYRFREAEVGLFIRMRLNGIGMVKLTALTLARNFRSLPEIVTWNNTHFSTLFPKYNDIATGAVTYSPSIAADANQATISNISIKGYAGFNENIQAEQVVQIIKATQAQSPNEKIAILVRSRNHLNKIIPALKKANLNFRAIDIDPLSSRQHIQDLIALTSALLHPADRIAWLTILRAPWCGLTLADLLVVAGDNAYTTLYEQLNREDIIKALSPEGQTRITRILPILRNKLFERDRYDLRTWIESTWQLLGGPASLNEATDVLDVEEFFKLLSTMDSQHLTLEKLKDNIAKLYAASESTEDLLQIMTIHSAKGLEFDTVILPHLERKMPVDDKALLLWMERPLLNDQTALLLAPIHKTGSDKDSMYEFIHRQQKIKSEYEIERLLYVATTRAKKNLHLVFSINHTDKEFTPEPGSFLKKLWPQIEKHKLDIITENTVIPSLRNEHVNTSQRSLHRLEQRWINPLQLAQRADATLHKQQNGFSLIETTPKIIGVVTHRILQMLAQYGPSWWFDKNNSQQLSYIQTLLIQQCIAKSVLLQAQTTIHSAINKTLQDVRGQWILQAHTQAQAEFAITSIINTQPVNLIVDRTFVDENDVRWIIDYKTTTFSHQDLDTFLTDEQEKYLNKMLQYKDAIHKQDARQIKLGLYFPMIQAWKEW